MNKRVLKKIGVTVFVLTTLTLITFPFVMIVLLNNLPEEIVDMTYLDIVFVMWGIGVLISIMIKGEDEDDKNR